MISQKQHKPIVPYSTMRESPVLLCSVTLRISFKEKWEKKNGEKHFRTQQPLHTSQVLLANYVQANTPDRLLCNLNGVTLLFLSPSRSYQRSLLCILNAVPVWLLLKKKKPHYGSFEGVLLLESISTKVV